ncbi:hypothetical protein M0R45_026317 [Rubus argutus]|uniref:Uncharacterized protein n=1 Tax=Rubus argutus TaxID=59490 RepID=A0AAW1WYY8_RUBAR
MSSSSSGKEEKMKRRWRGRSGLGDGVRKQPRVRKESGWACSIGRQRRRRWLNMAWTGQIAVESLDWWRSFGENKRQRRTMVHGEEEIVLGGSRLDRSTTTAERIGNSNRERGERVTTRAWLCGLGSTGNNGEEGGSSGGAWGEEIATWQNSASESDGGDVSWARLQRQRIDGGDDGLNGCCWRRATEMTGLTGRSAVVALGVRRS